MCETFWLTELANIEDEQGVFRDLVYPQIGKKSTNEIYREKGKYYDSASLVNVIWSPYSESESDLLSIRVSYGIESLFGS